MSEAEPKLISVGGMVADEDTGEIVEWEGVDILNLDLVIARLHGDYLLAKDQSAEWESARKFRGLVLLRQLQKAGLHKASGDFGTVTAIADTSTKSARREAVDQAVTDELITTTERDAILIAAARELDPAKVEAWCEEHVPDAKFRTALKALLVPSTPRRGYALVKGAQAIAPKREKVAAPDA